MNISFLFLASFKLKQVHNMSDSCKEKAQLPSSPSGGLRLINITSSAQFPQLSQHSVITNVKQMRHTITQFEKNIKCHRADCIFSITPITEGTCTKQHSNFVKIWAGQFMPSLLSDT